ncbi:MAG: TraR/DksA family transcriptional regulator [Bacteriovoracaceae bacterium]
MSNPYYDQQFLDGQKELLLKLKQELMTKLQNASNEDLHVSPDQTVEDGDQAQTYLNQNVSFGLREREIIRLREIEAALYRLNDGTYGVCEETEEPIGKKRLQKMPWTRLSIQAAEQVEREQAHFRRSG